LTEIFALPRASSRPSPGTPQPHPSGAWRKSLPGSSARRRGRDHGGEQHAPCHPRQRQRAAPADV